MQALVCSGGGVMQLASLDEVRKEVQDRKRLVWIDLPGKLSPEEQEMLQKWFGFHELALEDAAKNEESEARRQRPKIEEYDSHYFMVVQAVTTHREDRLIIFDRHEIDIFAGENFVVTVHKDQLREISDVWTDAQKRPGLMQCGSDRLVYYLLDAVVDNYLDIADEVEDMLDDLSNTLIDPRAGRNTVQDIFTMKKQLLYFRRASMPLRDVVNQMMTRNFPYITDETVRYLRDIYDHVMRLGDMIDTYRDILTGALDVYMSAVSNSLNYVMKRLTVVATIFLPLTFITGFWGMNFQDFMPLESSFWYWGSVIFMAALGIGMTLYLSWSWIRKMSSSRGKDLM